ncbi:MAG: DUF4835 family protein [Bacteroidales bacterium]|nr:DUF4835 family protein [Bacteroidales bacterium]
MKKKTILFIVIILSAYVLSSAQELNCNVQVVTQQIQGTNKKIFQTLQAAIYEFVNTRTWTNNVYSYSERIECNILINLTDQISSDEFKGTIQVQARRPVFNTTYNSTVFNFIDNNFHIRYVEFEPLEFNETSYLSNLTSILAYYIYIIIGLDNDSFSFEGGSLCFEKAEAIVMNAQNAPYAGWKPYEGSGNRNRYWLVKNILDVEYSPVREFFYRYHRMGLDKLESATNEARIEIIEGLRLLQEVYRKKPDPYLFLLQIIFDAKADEFVNIFSESFTEEKGRVLKILKEMDPSNSRKYEKINSET